MVKRRLPDIGILSIIVFAFIVLVPMQVHAQGLSYNGWELDGFLRNNTGVWTESWDYAPNQDPLATFRNWFRLNLNGNISDSLRLKAEILAIYEPEYEREDGATEAGLTPIEANEYNYFDFRELRLDWRPAMGHNIRIGKQIVNWGESISARVGDVINPVDARFDLGFTNLEDTRLPIWMVRGMHQFYSIGTSFDWIFSPYNQADRYRASRTLAAPFAMLWSDGSLNNLYPGLVAAGALEIVPEGGQRFSPQPEYRLIRDGQRIPHSQIFTINPLAGMKEQPDFLEGGPIGYTPQNSLYTQLPAGYDIPGTPFTTPEAGYYLLDLNSFLGGNPGKTLYPGSGLDDARWGFKTSSTFFGTQTGVYFFHRHRFTPVARKVPVDGGFRFDTDYSDEIDNYGFYANKNFDFGVVRLDANFQPNYPFNAPSAFIDGDGVVEKDRLLVQLGFDKDFMFRPLNEFQTFNMILEYVGGFILEDEEDITLSFITYTPVPKDDHTFFASIGTNYNFGMYAPNLTLIYNTENAGLFQPSFTYNPDWMNRKWSFKLQYNMVFGDKLETAYGLLEEKDMVLFTTQFSFP